MEWVIILVLTVISVVLYYDSRKNRVELTEQLELLSKSKVELNESLINNTHIFDDLSTQLKVTSELQAKLEEEDLKNKKILSQKKSSETRLGQISEQIAPFLKDCPYDPKTMSFLGNPIDFCVFDYDAGEIIFLEVKSGNSKESSRQRIIKNIIKEGKVYYERMTINEKGVRIKREENNG